MSDVTIRPMRPDEADVVGQLTLDPYDRAGERIEGDYRDWLARPLERLPYASAILVAVDGDDRVLGTVTYVTAGDEELERDDHGDCGFRMLAVAPSAWGRGVGRALLEACIDRARFEGRRRMLIHSMRWMTRAHALYERYGFVRRPDLDVRFPGGDGLVFTLDLTVDAADHFPPPGDVPAEPPWYEDAWGRTREG